MELIERVWEGTGNFFGGIMRGFERSVTAIFGSSNARFVKRMQAKIDAAKQAIIDGTLVVKPYEQ